MNGSKFIFPAALTCVIVGPGMVVKGETLVVRVIGAALIAIGITSSQYA